MTITVTPTTHGPALHAAVVRTCQRLRAELEPYRGKDPGVDAFFARCEELERLDADRAAAAPSPAAVAGE